MKPYERNVYLLEVFRLGYTCILHKDDMFFGCKDRYAATRLLGNTSLDLIQRQDVVVLDAKYFMALYSDQTFIYLSTQGLGDNKRIVESSIPL